MSEFRDWTQRDDDNREIQLKIDWIMEDHINRAFERIYEEIDAGKYTRKEAEDRLYYWDMADYFRDWWEQGS